MCYVDKAQNCWDEHLTQIAGALRSAVNRNSGFTAKKLMLGWGVNIPVDLFYPAPRRGTPALQTAHESARGRLRTSEKRMKQEYDLKAYFRAYEERDLVYIFDTATVKGKCRKLSPFRKGTGIVIKKLSPYLYRVKTKVAVMVASHDRLKKCAENDIPL